VTTTNNTTERHFTVLELADHWQVSPRTVKREIERES
jgi:hypothetical protein